MSNNNRNAFNKLPQEVWHYLSNQNKLKTLRITDLNGESLKNVRLHHTNPFEFRNPLRICHLWNSVFENPNIVYFALLIEIWEKGNECSFNTLMQLEESFGLLLIIIKFMNFYFKIIWFTTYYFKKFRRVRCPSNVYTYINRRILK